MSVTNKPASIFQIRALAWKFGWSSAICGLAMFVGALNDVRAQTIVAVPPIPVTGSPVAVDIYATEFGGPLQVMREPIERNNSFVDITLHIVPTPGSATRAAIRETVPLPELPPGPYLVRVFVTSTAFIEPDNPPTLVASQMLTVMGKDARVAAVEYYNAPRDHYFMTASATEIALLDAGKFAGWVRTGQSLSVYIPAVSGQNVLLAPVCRYYGLPAFGLDTHFFSGFDFECSAITLFGEKWVYETSDAFEVALPNVVYDTTNIDDPDAGTCARGTLPVYRVYNGRADANHRYISSRSARDAMVASGWIAEGVGADAVGFCIPATE